MVIVSPGVVKLNIGGAVVLDIPIVLACVGAEDANNGVVPVNAVIVSPGVVKLNIGGAVVLDIPIVLACVGAEDANNGVVPVNAGVDGRSVGCDVDVG